MKDTATPMADTETLIVMGLDGKVLTSTERRAVDADGRSVRVIVVEALALRRAATDLRVLVPSKLSLMSSQATAAGVVLDVAVASDVPIAQLDGEKIAWAVTTLVGNALRYVQTGSPRLSGTRITVRVTFDAALSSITLEVQDDGPGIPADTVARLFKRDGLNVRGSGLALLLMSDVCSAHGGSIDVRSSIDASGHGTTIRMMLPA